MMKMRRRRMIDSDYQSVWTCVQIIKKGVARALLGLRIYHESSKGYYKKA
jgi:hypothetical protein